MTHEPGFISRRPWSSVSILALLTLGVLIWSWRVELQLFPTIISAYTAKEYCSCRYVMSQSADYCQSYVKQWLPSTLVEDQAARRITASGLGRVSSAVWEGSRQGCRLLSPLP